MSADPGRAVSESDWSALAKAVSGRVLRPGDPGFGPASTPFNERFAAVTPAGVVTVADTADIRTAIRWARSVGIHAVARCGGHSYAGNSVSTGLVIDLSRLNTVTVDASTGLVRVGGGATMADIYAAIQPYEMAYALGNGATVGIAGLTLGGGYGATSRVHGLTADALVETTVLTADGELLRCDANENPDLFWACRGGAGATSGSTPRSPSRPSRCRTARRTGCCSAGQRRNRSSRAPSRSYGRHRTSSRPGPGSAPPGPTPSCR